MRPTVAERNQEPNGAKRSSPGNGRRGCRV